MDTKDINGYLHTDAYFGYRKVKDMYHCLCWAHVQRNFVDVCPKDIKSPGTTLPATGIAYYNQLFDLEGKLKDLSTEERKKQRLKHERPALEAFWSWVKTTITQVLPKSKLESVLQYAVNHKEKLETYLKDGNCVILQKTAFDHKSNVTVGFINSRNV